MAVKKTYRINLRNYGSPPAVMVSQYDEGYAIAFEIFDGPLPVLASSLSGYTFKLKGRQPGNPPFLAYEFEGTLATALNAVVSFEIDTTMTGRAGKGTAELVILDEENDVKFASVNFAVYTEPAAVPDGSIDADVQRAMEIAEEVQEIVDTAAAEVKGEAEAWAVGQRDGEDVPSTDPTYENNAKYYAEQAQDIADSIGIDATLSISGKAADAKKTGDEISSLKEDLNIESYAYPYGIQPFQMSMFNPSSNLFSDVFCNFISRAYYGINTSHKLAVKTSSKWKGWLIRVKPNTVYTFGPVDYLIRFFTATLDVDTAETNVSATDSNTVTSGGNSYWVSIAQNINRDMSEWMMVEGDTYPSEYVSGYPQWIAQPKVPDNAMKHISMVYAYKPIAVNYSNEQTTVFIPSGSRVMTATGVPAYPSGATTLNVNVTNWISYDVTAGEWFVGYSRSGHETYTVGWVNLGYKVAYFNARFVEIYDDGDTPSDVKTIAFMGDSITAGVAAQGKAYHMYIHNKYGYNCLNYGFGGAGFYKNSTSQTSGRVGQGVPGIAPATTPENFFTPNNVPARLTELNASTLDGIVIFAGTNDWGNDISVENYISGIESAFDYIYNNLTGIPVLVMTPIHRKGDTTPNSQGKTLREYVDILINECKKYGLPYVDCMTMSGIYPDNDANKTLYFGDEGGLHPNKEGHKRIAVAIADALNSVISVGDYS